MAAPIDELLISVEIEEGSKLADLHKMLTDLQASGGKIEAKVPAKELGHIIVKLKSLNTKIDKLREFLAPLVEKFPELITEFKELNKNLFQELKDFLKHFNEWGDKLRTDIFKELEKVIENIVNLKDKIEKGKVKPGYDADLREKTEEYFQLILERFAEFLMLIEKTNDRISAVGGKVTLQGGLIREAIEGIHVDLDYHLNFNNKTRDLILDEIKKVANELLDFIINFESFRVDITKKIEEGLALSEKISDKSFEMFDIVVQTQTTIEGIGEKVNAIKEKQLKMNEEILQLIKEHAIIIKNIGKTQMKLPGIKALGEPQAVEGLSGFWRKLIGLLLRDTAEDLKKHVMAHMGGIGRELEGLGGYFRKSVDSALRFKFKEEGTKKERLEQLFDALRGVNVVDLIKGIIPRPQEVKVVKIRGVQQERISELINENTMRVDHLIKIFHDLSNKLENTGKWMRTISTNYLDPTMKTVQDINAKLEGESPHAKREKKQRKRKARGVR